MSQSRPSAASAGKAAATKRFGEKRQAIIRAASVLVNEAGVQATTFSKIAAAIGLNATSVTYYFPRKDRLIAAVYAQTLDRMERMAREALAQPCPPARLRYYLAAHVALRTRIRNGETGLLTALSEIRTLDEETQAPLLIRYRDVVELICGFFAPAPDLAPAPQTDARRQMDVARAHMLLEAMMWWPVWSLSYSLLDFPRVEERLFDILANGLPAVRGRWQPVEIAGGWRGRDVATDPETPTQNEEFLRAATVMVNQRGYRGASVDRIAQSLHVTKGSFYHHHDAKDDLVLACFQTSYDRLSAVQMKAQAIDGDYWTALSSVLAELVDLQFRDPTPLLRTTALQALDSAHRDDVITRSNRLAQRFAGLLIDGIADGSVRAIDPLIASQVIMSTLNAAYEARHWAERFEDPDLAIRTYLSPLFSGLIDTETRTEPQ